MYGEAHFSVPNLVMFLQCFTVHALSPNFGKFFTKPFVMFLIAPEIQVVPYWAQLSGSNH